jgi:hypothetical protein
MEAGYKAPHKHVDCKSSLLTLGLIRGEALTGSTYISQDHKKYYLLNRDKNNT